MNRALLVVLSACAAAGACVWLCAPRGAEPEVPHPMRAGDVTDAVPESKQGSTLADGARVRILSYRQDDPDAILQDERVIETRKLTDDELRKLGRSIAHGIRGSMANLQRVRSREDKDTVDYAIAENSHLLELQLVQAAERELKNGKAFTVTKATVNLQSPFNGWYYWNASVVTGETSILARVPIWLADYPAIEGNLKLREQLQEYERTERAFEWNRKPYEERKALWDARTAAWTELRGIQEECRTIEETVGRQELRTHKHYQDLLRRAQTLNSAVRGVPGRVNKSTLIAEPR